MGSSASMASYKVSPEPKVVDERHGLKRPRRIVLIRHGQSTGNVDESVYEATPDWRVPLTTLGWDQAVEAGRSLRTLVETGPVFVYTSPYRRCTETLDGVLKGGKFGSEEVACVRVEPRLREQDFGNFQDAESMRACKADRLKYGRFFYRFPCGESGADVYDRVSNWFDSLYRDMDFGGVTPETTVVVVTHGLTSRLFLMRWYHWSVECFEGLGNPPNAQLLVLDRDSSVPNSSYFALNAESRAAIGLPEVQGDEDQEERLRQIAISRNLHLCRSSSAIDHGPKKGRARQRPRA